VLPIAASVAVAPSAQAQTEQQNWARVCEDWDEWDKPAPPFNIFGNTWHVGTCGISVILVTDDEGHILLDGGTQAGAEVVVQNMATLGLDIRDVGLIGFSHEHFDHVGGIAQLQDLSGASLVSSAAAAPVMESGISSEDDPQADIHEPFAPARVDFVQGDGEGMGIGDSFLVSISTPGHTPGAMSWYWQSCEGDVCKTIVYADSLSPISSDGYRFSEHPEYVQAYRDGLERLAALDCDILLTPHPSASGMRDKLLAGDLTSGTNCADYAASISTRLDARLAEEMETTP
jgi:metallo-beta-lactamase class B